jgi:hypothetical protein
MLTVLQKPHGKENVWVLLVEAVSVSIQYVSFTDGAILTLDKLCDVPLQNDLDKSRFTAI